MVTEYFGVQVDEAKAEIIHQLLGAKADQTDEGAKTRGKELSGE
jgi:hypothetical protein